MCYGLKPGELNATAEGTWEKVWARRRGKVPLLGRARGGGADSHRKLSAPKGGVSSQRVGWGGLWHRLQVVRSHLLVYGILGASCAGYWWPGTSCVG